MSVVDEFILFFKSNAKQVKEEIGDLDYAIATLAKKGHARSEQEEKDLKDLRKQRTGLTQDLKDQTRTTDDLSSSLLRVGLQAVAAFTTFEGLKAGISNAVEFNANLERMAEVTGANVKELAAYDATFAQFHANAGDFSTAFENIAKQTLLVGGNVGVIIPNLRELNKQIYEMGQSQGSDAARRLFEISNIKLHGALPQSLENAFLADPAQFEQVLEQQERQLAVTQKTAEASSQLEASWKELGTEAKNAFTPLIPILSFILDLAKLITRTFHGFFDIFNIANVFSESTRKANFRDFDKTATGLFDGLFGKGANVNVSTAGSGSSTNGRTPLGIRNNNPGNLRFVGQSGAIDGQGGFAQFGSLQQGLSAEDKQLALYGKRGINTVSGVISKWAPSNENNTEAYIAAVTKATGFGANQQLDLSDPSVRMKLSNAINAQENGASYGNLLLSQADKSPTNNIPSGGSGHTININTITVQTQATDANGISKDIGKSLNEQLTYLATNANDGIAK